MLSNRKLRAAASVLAFVILFGVAGKCLRYITQDDVHSYTRVTFHEMYEQENIDLLFIGSSHCYRSFDPAIFDSALGLNSFNAGTSDQFIDGGLMIVKEAAKRGDIKQVVLELFFTKTYQAHAREMHMTATYIISDYLRPSFDKYAYMLAASGPASYGNSFFVSRRYADSLVNPMNAVRLIKEKSSREYRSFDYSLAAAEDMSEWYAGKGFVAGGAAIEGWDLFAKSDWLCNGRPIELKNISDEWKEYFERTVDFCRENGIKLTVVAAPMTDYLLADKGNYDEYVSYIRDYFSGLDIEYYDFNLCREEYFPCRSEYFADTSHLNREGAQALSTLFAGILKGELSPDEVFHGSYGEKLGAMKGKVFGVGYTVSDGVKNCRIISSGGEGVEYEISVAPEEGERYVIREYDSSPRFSLDGDISGKCVIQTRIPGGETIETVLTIG